MFSETIAEPALGLANVEKLTPGTADIVDEVGGGASEPLSHVERLFGSLDGVEGGGKGTGVASPAVARKCTWGGGGKSVTG